MPEHKYKVDVFNASIIRLLNLRKFIRCLNEEIDTPKIEIATNLLQILYSNLLFLKVCSEIWFQSKTPTNTNIPFSIPN